MSQLSTRVRALAHGAALRWHRADPVLAGMLMLIAVMVLWYATDVGGPRAQVAVAWLSMAAFTTTTALYSHRIVSRLDRSNPARRFWRAVSLAALTFGLGYAVQLVTAIPNPSSLSSISGGTVKSVCLGLGAAGVVIVMITYPLRLQSRRERACFWLDIATVMVGATVFGWYFAAADATDSFVHGQLLEGLLRVISGPVVLLIAVFALGKLLLRGSAPFTLGTGLIAAVASASGGLAQGIGPALIGSGHQKWFFVLNILGDALGMVATRIQFRAVNAEPAVLGEGQRRPYSLLPYVSIAAIYGLLVAALIDHGLEVRAWIVLAGAVANTGLVVARQLAAFTENARLLGDLRGTEKVLRAALDERDALASQLRYQAFHDPLTGLANRALLADRLDDAYAKARRDRRDVALMIIDLDDFKPINDRFGHAAGDRVIAEIAERLTSCLREADTVARLGGDEFAILVHDPVADEVEVLAQRLVAAVQEPFSFDGQQVVVGASIGIGVDPEGWGTPEALVRDADTAMYEAKARGGAVRNVLRRGGAVVVDGTDRPAPHTASRETADEAGLGTV